VSWACVTRFGGIGDNLIVTTAFPALRAKYGHLEVITKTPMHVVFENNPYIDKLSVRKTDLPAKDAAEYRAWLRDRAQESDFFMDLGQSCEWAHAQFNPQSSFDWSLKARRKRFGGSYLETVHDICDVPYEPMGAQFYPTDEEVARAQETRAERFSTSPVIGWVCCGSRVDKHHPRDDLIVAQLIRDTGAMVALFGGYAERDWEVARRIEKAVRQVNGGNDRLRLCMSPKKEEDVWPIRRGLTQLQHCDLVITVDTGPWWAVSQQSMPKILMPSHASAENLAAHAQNTVVLQADAKRVPCYSCHRLHDDVSTCVSNAENDGAACLSDVTVPAVIKAAKALLAGETRLSGRAFTSEELLAELRGPAVVPPSDNLIAWAAK
jgi:ADP-heptose:LPS heptosyltransferase